MKEALARTSRTLALIWEYGIQTYQGLCLLFADNESELDDRNNRVRRLERKVLDRKKYNIAIAGSIFS